MNRQIDSNSPLSGIKVLDFGHTVMGPCCGLILADLGAEVVRVEPINGDPTRNLKGFGSGFFGFFGRNKKSISIDLKNPEARPAIEAGIKWADVIIENFGPGTMQRLGLDYDTVAALNDQLIYCALKGFLPGPYSARPALDEIVQMMGGLAYMTGPSGRPLRAGSSIVDITGGMFGAIAILAALRERALSGKGTLVQSALFETTSFLVGQHMAMSRLGGTDVTPMPERAHAWGVYDLFDVFDGQTFVGITSDKQWVRFCERFGFTDFATDERLATNNMRVEARPWLIPALAERLRTLSMSEVAAGCEAAEVPFSQVRTPEDLFDDPHLNSNHSLLRTTTDRTADLPALPVRIGAHVPEIRLQPQPIGAQTRALLTDWGIDEELSEALLSAGAVRSSDVQAVIDASAN